MKIKIYLVLFCFGDIVAGKVPKQQSIEFVIKLGEQEVSIKYNKKSPTLFFRKLEKACRYSDILMSAALLHENMIRMLNQEERNILEKHRNELSKENREKVEEDIVIEKVKKEPFVKDDFKKCNNLRY